MSPGHWLPPLLTMAFEDSPHLSEPWLLLSSQMEVHTPPQKVAFLQAGEHGKWASRLTAVQEVTFPKAGSTGCHASLTLPLHKDDNTTQQQQSQSKDLLLQLIIL